MQSVIYNIDSRHRNTTMYPKSSKFKYVPDDQGQFVVKNVVEMKLSSIEFPNTCHYFNSVKGNTTFTVTTSGTTVTVTIPDGNYNSDELITAVNAGTNMPATITFSTDKNTGVTTMKTTVAHTINFTNTTNSEYQSLGGALGFSSTDDITTGASEENLESDMIPNSVGEHYFLLRVNDYGTIMNKGRRFMSKIIMLAPKYEVTFDSRTRYVSKIYKFQQPTDISNLDIEVLDFLNNSIDLKGINFSFTIEFTTISNQLLKKYHELSFYSGDLLELVLNDNMLEYYTKKNEEEESNKKIQFQNNFVGNELLNQMNDINVNDQLMYYPKDKTNNKFLNYENNDDYTKFDDNDHEFKY